MPVARGPQINARSAVLVGLSGVVVALLIGALVIWAASSSDEVRIQVGDTDFDAGQTVPISDEIADRGPILFSDVGSSGTRDIILQHLGDDPDVGWSAFAARRAGDPRDCFFEWKAGRGEFELGSQTDTECDDEVVDASGTGLQQYPVEVVDARVRVDLNFDSEEDPEEDDS